MPGIVRRCTVVRDQLKNVADKHSRRNDFALCGLQKRAARRKSVHRARVRARDVPRPVDRIEKPLEELSCDRLPKIEAPTLLLRNAWWSASLCCFVYHPDLFNNHLTGSLARNRLRVGIHGFY